jgi:hypothetical protein
VHHLRRTTRTCLDLGLLINSLNSLFFLFSPVRRYKFLKKHRGGAAPRVFTRAGGGAGVGGGKGLPRPLAPSVLHRGSGPAAAAKRRAQLAAGHTPSGVCRTPQWCWFPIGEARGAQHTLLPRPRPPGTKNGRWANWPLAGRSCRRHADIPCRLPHLAGYCISITSHFAHNQFQFRPAAL